MSYFYGNCWRLNSTFFKNLQAKLKLEPQPDLIATQKFQPSLVVLTSAMAAVLKQILSISSASLRVVNN
jgi:hypothetical protein